MSSTHSFWLPQKPIGDAQGAVGEVLNFRVDVANQITAPVRRFARLATDFIRKLIGDVARAVSDEKANPLRVVTAQQQINTGAVETLPVGWNATYEEIQAAGAQAAVTNGFEVIFNRTGERMVDVDAQWVPL